jgi:hypothetical protein
VPYGHNGRLQTDAGFLRAVERLEINWCEQDVGKRSGTRDRVWQHRLDDVPQSGGVSTGKGNRVVAARAVFGSAGKSG